MKAEIVSISSHYPSEPYYRLHAMLASVKKVGAEVTLLGMGEPWRGLMTKPRIMREWLRGGQNQTEFIIFVDAWDIIFQKHPDDMLDEYWHMYEGSKPLVFNAERSCFPRGDLAEHFPETGTPFRYLNSGFIMGPAAGLRDLLEFMDLDSIPDDHQLPDQSWYHPNDQGEYTSAYVKRPVPMELDTKARLCMSLHGTAPEGLELLPDGLVRNLVTDTIPGVFHGNGSGKELLPLIISHLGI